MAKSRTPNEKRKDGEPVVEAICRNRRAAFDYELSDTVECGIVLVGTEVKTLREKQASLEDAYAHVDDNNEVWLIGCEIPQYPFGNRQNHEPKRERKLLLKKREIAKFAARATIRGLTLIPTKLYFKDGRAKVELAVAKGKQVHDKRESVRDAESKRELARELRQRRRQD